MESRLRTYHEVPGEDRSRLAEQVTRQRERITERLAPVKHVVLVMSGKGGVGKSHVTAGLAVGLAGRLPGGVGVLDADLHGPTTAALLDAHGPLRVGETSIAPAEGRSGVKVFSMDLLLEEGQPVRWRGPSAEQFVWRGTLELGAVREFLCDVEWGSLALLLVDLPPGAAHAADLADLIQDITGAIAVTLPSEESRRSVERAMHAAADAGIRLLGVVENMSGYACEKCGETRPLFNGEAGRVLSQTFAVPLLGRVPFDPPSAPSASPAPILPTQLLDAFLGILP